MRGKKRLLGMTLEELKKVSEKVGLPSYAAKQIADWLYKKRITTIADMTNLAASKRTLLEEHYEIGAIPPAEAFASADGTIK
jgi:23S rRNA (adenine2503-C2)-methyltransferase